jgi:molecular chaperone GrpE
MTDENTNKKSKENEENLEAKPQDVEESIDDVTIESDDTLDDSVLAEESLQETVKKLREKLKLATKEKQEYLDGWQRTKADYMNAKKEEEASRKIIVKYAKEDLIGEILPVLESFDMAFVNKEQWEKVDKNWRTGVEYIYSQFRNVLLNNGLTEVNPVGLPFDPNRDEAIEHVAVTEESDDHKVIEVVQKGYELHGKLIKAPRVKVGKLL